MADPLQELLNPQVEEPRARSVWPRLAGGVLVLGVIIGGMIQLGGSDEPAPESAATASSTVATASSLVPEDTNTVPDTTAVADGPGVVLDDPLVLRAEYGPDPEFAVADRGESQVLLPIDEITLGERAWLDGTTTTLDAGERLAIGITEGQLRMLSLVGSMVDPYSPTYGAPGACYRVGNANEGTSECFGYEAPGTPTALFVGLVGVDFLGWGLLPEDAAVAVLLVNDVAVGWQRPLGSTVLFTYTPQIGDQIELIVLDASGDEIARGNRSRPVEPVGGFVEPITGYGDFSDVPLDEVDLREVTSLIVTCMIDQGFAVSLPPPDAPLGERSVDLFDIPEHELAAVDLAHARCRAGLNIPGREPPSVADLQKSYEFLIGVHQCLVDLGFEIESPSPFEEWVTAPPETQWDPILIMSLHYSAEAEPALRTCIEE